jgi:hypothetical protein
MMTPMERSGALASIAPTYIAECSAATGAIGRRWPYRARAPTMALNTASAGTGEANCMPMNSKATAAATSATIV